jgi:uncharacterized protein (TIGR02246 family)
VNVQSTESLTDIAKVNETFMCAFERGDAAGVAACYADGGQVLPPGSDIITGKEAIEAFWSAVMEMGVKKVELTTLELDHQGDTAIDIGRVALYTEAGDKIDDPKFLVVWKREGGQWKIHRDIWNSDTAPGD